MPGVLTHKAIMLLARERIRALRDLLTGRVTSGGRVTDLEHRLLFLATKAHELLSGPPVPSIDIPSFPQHPFSGVNKFAVMGSMGPDFTAFSAILAPGQGWAFDAVHKGSPDENRELVVAKTTDFVFAFNSRVREALLHSHLDGDLTDTQYNDAVKAMQAYSLGHLCHIAGDALSHPYINDIEWHLGTGLHGKFTHAGGEGSIEAEVARQVLLRRSTREGQSWEAWWPTVDEVPRQFYGAYAEALEYAYKATSRPPSTSSATPPGPPGAADLVFGEFRQHLLDLAPPTVDEGFVRDGYHLYRNGILGYGYGHGLWGWTGVLIWLAVPLVALYPIASALPNAQAMFRPGAISSAAWAEFLGLALGLASPFVLGYGCWLLSLTSLGVENRLFLGMLASTVNVIFAILYFVNLGTSFLPPWAPWLFILISLAAAGAFGIAGGINLGRAGHRAGGGAMMIFSLPAIYVALALLFYVILFLGERELLGGDTARNVYVVIVTVVLAMLFFFGIFCCLAQRIRDARVPEEPEGFPAEQRHFVRLFDDASLAKDGDGRLYFPAAGRPLLKLWWEGTGDLWILSRRYQLELSFDGTTVHQTVAAPIAPTTAAEYGQFLTATVTDSLGATGHLRTALAFPDDPLETTLQLPPGAVFADPADDLATKDKITTEEDREIAAGQFQKLGTRHEDAFVLHHAPKAAQAIRFGPDGPVIVPRSGEEPVTGSGKVTSQGTTVTGSGTHFQAFFEPGDYIRVRIDDKTSQTARVATVGSDIQLTLRAAFEEDVDSGKPYERWGSNREARNGYRYIAEPVEAEPGDAVMDYAADFAALLCLGAVPSLVDSALVPGLLNRAPLSDRLGAVGQVFRNWSLDRRRLNEWRMVVAGGAVSEKAGHPERADRAMSNTGEVRFNPDPAIAQEGERVANTLGWVPLLRQFMDLLSDLSADPAAAGGDALASAARRPDVPPNLDLSRAVAFLFDLPNPRVLT
jgi:hypothetical protein